MRCRVPSPSAPPEVADRGERDDRGSAILLALVLVTVCGVITAALASMAATVIKSSTIVDARRSRIEAAKGAVRLAIDDQRHLLASACVSSGRVVNVVLNGIPVDVSCKDLDVQWSGGGRFGVVTTQLTPAAKTLTAVAGGNVPLNGKVFVAGGQLSQPANQAISVTNELHLSVGSYPSVPDALRYEGHRCDEPTFYGTFDVVKGPKPVCDAQTWDGAATPVVLPQLSPYARPSAPMATLLNGCKVFYPGRYTAPITLTSGQYYFASGVYDFESTVTINGAQVTGGEGNTGACKDSTDADAAFDDEAPLNHNITGMGVTFVFGGTGKLVVGNAAGTALVLNRRIADTTTQSSAGVSIATVVPALATADQFMTASQAINASGATVSASSLGWKPSTLIAGDDVVSVALGSAARFTVNGYVAVPNAGVHLLSANANATFQLLTGILASRLNLDVAAPTATWAVGLVDVPVQRTVNITATSKDPKGATATSSAVVQVDDTGNFAINSWRVDS